jgi:hypothetical protein
LNAKQASAVRVSLLSDPIFNLNAHNNNSQCSSSRVASRDVEVERDDIQEDEHEGMQGAKEDEVLQLGEETSGQVRELTLRSSSTYSKSATLTLS